MPREKDSVVHIVAAALVSLSALGCGEERPPWAGFDLFPPDASTFELAPELQSSLRAAEIAFLTQLAAEQGVNLAGADVAPQTSSNSADAGVTRPPRMAAAAGARSRSNAQADEPQKSDASVAMPAAAGRAAPDTRSDQPMQPSAPDTAVTAGTGAGGQAGAAGQPAQFSELDAGVES